MIVQVIVKASFSLCGRLEKTNLSSLFSQVVPKRGLTHFPDLNGLSITSQAFC